MDFFTEKQQGEMEGGEKRFADWHTRQSPLLRPTVSLLRVKVIIQRDLSCQRGVTTAEKRGAL